MAENIYSHISTSTTTVICPSPGVILHSVTVNTPGTSFVVTIQDYNGTSGTNNTVAVIGASATSPVYIYDITLNNGLTVVTSGTAGDITVTWH